MWGSWGKLLILLGAALLAVGLVVLVIERLAGGSWRLPGDLEFGWRGGRVWIPIASSIVLSIILTIVLNLIAWFFRRR